jgi:thiol-disulfide isomerase/thioredoxin
MPKQGRQAGEQRGEKHKTASARRQVGGVLSILILATVAFAVIAILFLKEGRLPTSTTGIGQAGSASTVPGVTADGSSVASVTAGRSATDQLSWALNQKQPALVFMHSTSCQSCNDMMKVVDQIYPEFRDRVLLVDVDVYDEANARLMQLLELRYIPTVVVFDKEGQATRNVGVMKPDAFRQLLTEHALGG